MKMKICLKNFILFIQKETSSLNKLNHQEWWDRVLVTWYQFPYTNLMTIVAAVFESVSRVTKHSDAHAGTYVSR